MPASVSRKTREWVKPVSANQTPASAEIVEEVAPAPKPKRKKKLIVIGAAAAAVLLGGGGTAFALMGGEKTEAAAGDDAPASAKGKGKDAGATFIDVPPMVVNLRSADGAARFIRVHFMLVPGPNGTEEGIKEKLPLLLDAYQPFLRELRPEDLAGSAAVFRIKEELLIRATDTLGAGQVKDVLIQDLIQQ